MVKIRHIVVVEVSRICPKLLRHNFFILYLGFHKEHCWTYSYCDDVFFSGEKRQNYHKRNINQVEPALQILKHLATKLLCIRWWSSDRFQVISSTPPSQINCPVWFFGGQFDPTLTENKKLSFYNFTKLKNIF